jgi:integrase/recombinase XerD
VYVTLSPGVGDEILSVTPVSERYLYWDGTEAKDNIVTRTGNAYRRVSELAGLKDENSNPLEFHSHMLRDSFAVWCFNQGLATEDVAALLGHRNITVTQQHYSPWISLRQTRLGAIMRTAYTQYRAEIPPLPAEIVTRLLLPERSLEQ